MQTCAEWITQATGITCHSDKVRPGYIFVAIVGRTTDGNAFAAAAAARGALVIVSDSPARLPPLTLPVITVKEVGRWTKKC